MNAIDLFVTGITTVFLTLGILALVTYLMGKVLSLLRPQSEDRQPVAAIAAKLRSEGRL
ncbi:MAG TPA: hypothetical protein ENN54_05610 [Thermoplasmatales archaeon]|nr:OadG family protein [Candidatus Thermoplasmatota archaeon]MDD5778995.1 OadG family protein [Candidatus Thermoplasmatota archaeon]HDS59748.1 hypothetical protein [Thermoplasmatales archaeon]